MKHKSLIIISICLFFFILVMAVIVHLQLNRQSSTQELSIEFLQFDKKISACKSRKLDNKILLITSKYCPHCKKVVDLILPLIKKYHLTKYFSLFDIINSADLHALNELRISTPYVPTLIVNCNAYLGAKDWDQYNKILAEFYSKMNNGKTIK